MADDGETADDTGGVGVRPGLRGAAATMREIGGSSIDDFNMLIVRQTAAALYVGAGGDEERQGKAAAAFAALAGIAPRGELEGMMAAQMVACHNAAMECYRRAAQLAQPLQARGENLAHAGRLSRATAALVEALDRRRSEGVPKSVIVEHRVTRSEPALTAIPAPAIPAPQMSAPQIPAKPNGNGHALNGHTAPGGTALS